MLVGFDEEVREPLCLTVAVPGVPAMEESTGKEKEVMSDVAEEIISPDELVDDDDEEGEVPEDPPAASESSANPTEAGLDRKTEYTFFCVQRVRMKCVRP